MPLKYATVVESWPNIVVFVAAADVAAAALVAVVKCPC